MNYLKTVLPLLILVAALHGIPATASETSVGGQAFTMVLSFDVNDDRSRITGELNDLLLLNIRKVEGLGWEVEVLEKGAGDDSRNLLYHSDRWRGPYPTQVFAWTKLENYFPDVRNFTVRGYGDELVVKLVDCIVESYGDEPVFKGGTVEVHWKPVGP